MPLSETEYPWGIACASLGMHENHTLENKFRAIQEAGFKYCEIGLGEYSSWVRAQMPNL
jgi:sugar phosphate isomerase/epimerase